MRRRTTFNNLFMLLAWLLLLGAGATFTSTAQAQPSFADPAFERTWARTDQPIADGAVSGTWIWGLAPLTPGMQEPYTQSPNGRRLVQYFDKSRMELTTPGEGDPGSPWYVTNGLLAAELIVGRIEVGDSEYLLRFPAEIPVAGDQLPRNGPSYATFTPLLDAVEQRTGQLVTQRLAWDRAISDDPALAAQGVTLAVYDEVTGHNLAAPFWSFMTSSRAVYEDDQYVDAPLFENPYYATGRPLTEPYWSDVVVAGTQQLVLIQCFERRCLTYTPANPDAWRVEAANIGQHYFQWRYGQSTATGTLLFLRDGDIFTINADGSEPRNLTVDVEQVVISAEWSPDGELIAFLTESGNDFLGYDSGVIHVMRADGASNVTIGPGSPPAWSPDSAHIAFSRLVSDSELPFDEDIQIYVAAANGEDQHQVTWIPPQRGFSHSVLPAWSPDGTYIAFRNINGYPGPGPLAATVYRVAADGSDVTPLAETRGNGDQRWSPDGNQIAFVSGRGGGNDFTGRLLWVVSADGSGLLQLAGGYETDPGSPDWSPDGRHIAYGQSQGDPGDPRYPNPYLPGGIYLVSPNGVERTHLTHFGQEPRWSPNGRFIAFHAFGFEVQADDYSGRAGVFVTDREGGGMVQIAEGGRRPRWRPGPVDRE